MTRRISATVLLVVGGFLLILAFFSKHETVMHQAKENYEWLIFPGLAALVIGIQMLPWPKRGK